MFRIAYVSHRVLYTGLSFSVWILIETPRGSYVGT